MLTLTAPASAAEEVKKSRFIAHAERVDNPDDALAFIERVSLADANHNCWAYRIGQNYRFSDDGEPTGSAGKPIYAAIEGRGLDHVAVVVTRYFGGIKLGVGGLVRAYGGCAASCLQAASTTEIRPRQRLTIDLGFDAVAAVHALLDRYEVEKLDEIYGPDGVQLDIELPCDLAEPFAGAVQDVTRGQSTLTETPESDPA